MATPVGHSIVGYTLARAAGVKSPQGLALAVGAASLPDIDFLLGYVATGDPLSHHRQVITHKPAFPLLVGVVTGLVAGARALLQGRLPTPGEVLRPAALATALVGSHIAMDPLPLPYDATPLRTKGLAEVLAAQAWNAVIDMAFYGTAATLLFERNGTNGKRAEA